MMHGFTENYVKVSCTYDPVLINEIQKVKLKFINEDGLMEIVPVYDPVQKTKSDHKDLVTQ